MCHQFITDPAGEVHRNSKANALITATSAGDCRIDADNFSVQIHQRAATVAGVNRRICLQELFPSRDSDPARFGADDACRDGFIEAERRTHRHYPIADIQLITIADRGSGQARRRLYLHNSNVRFWVGLPFCRFEFTPVVKFDQQLVGTVDHVVVGQNDA